jgi:alkanesulfonate monooxygenase SsuD/methylene tetrahydromethanopterin reductase-like flavin-dependent oxidoreductase (luciferase family)
MVVWFPHIITDLTAVLTNPGDEPHKGHAEAGFRGGGGVAQMDPVVFVSAMAAVTKSVAFGITGSTSYLNVCVHKFILVFAPLTKLLQPFVLSRTWSTLDHATKGRIAWNVVTSYSNSAARANGFEKVVPHDQRYERADEFMDLCYA